MAVPVPAFGDHRTSGHVKSGNQCGAAVTDVVVGVTLDVAQTHRQQRLGCDRGPGSAFSRHRKAQLPYRAG